MNSEQRNSEGDSGMKSNPFTVGGLPPLLRGFYIFYTVSVAPLAKTEVVQVVVRLPFCLYIPPTRYLLQYPRTGESVGFVPEKVWTDRAEGSTVTQDEPVVPGQTVYLKDTNIVTEPMGIPEAITGGLKGHNVEFDKDPTGYFRYTRLTIEMDWNVPQGFNPYRGLKGQAEEVIDALLTRTLDIVNYVVDLYRVVTGDAYVSHVPFLVVDEIRIGIPDQCSIRKQEKLTTRSFTYKCGYLPHLFSAHGIRPAIVNKPAEVIDAFRSTLVSSVQPQVYRLLALNAEAALDRRDTKLAVIESFLSLEVYVEQFYRSRFSNKMSAEEIDTILTREYNWRLKVRLKELLREHFGYAIPDLNNKLWQDWIDAHDIRNDLVHRNIEPSLEDARNVVDLNQAVIGLLRTF